MNIGESFTPAVRAQEVLKESSKAYGITAPVSALIVGQVLFAPRLKPLPCVWHFFSQ
jgi:hypothetical protein